MQYIEEQVTSVLHDVRAEVAPAANSNEDVVASIASCFALQRGRPAIRGKPQRQQFQRQQSLPRSPIMKKTTWRVSAAVWAKMSQEARDQDRFQVVLPANNSVLCPGIYNCRKNKTSVEHSIPIVAVGSLFHIHTCAEAEIKRHDRKDQLIEILLAPQ